MNWNKTELFGDNILLMGVVVTDVESKNYQATRQNMKELEGVILQLQKLMTANQIDAINVSWAGTKIMRRMSAQGKSVILLDKTVKN